MMPILQRIDARLQATAEEHLRAELLAERGTYMARLGQFSEVHDLSRKLRERFGDGRFPRVSIWLMILDGILGFFERLDPASTDRLLRAHEVARAAGFIDLNRTAASWLVMNGFNTGKFESMALFIERYIEASGLESDSAACRVAVIVTYSELYAGRFERARDWFERARHLAVEVGDETSIASLMYGRAAMHNCRARLNSILGRTEPFAEEFADLEVEVSESFHRATGQSSLGQFLDVLRARLLLSRAEYVPAAKIFASLVDANVSVSILGDHLILRTEHAVCLLRAGLQNEAHIAVRAIDVEGAKRLGVDDQVVFWHYLEELAKGLGFAELHQQAQHEFDKASSLYSDEMERLCAILDRLMSPLDRAFSHVQGWKGKSSQAAVGAIGSTE